MKLFALRFLAGFVLLGGVPTLHAQTQSPLPAPIVMTGADLRPALSLDGDWHFIQDPYRNGLFDSRNHVVEHGWFENKKAKPGDQGTVEYSFADSPTLKVPGDWNTQRAELLWYEGPMWYEKDFDFEPKEHSRTFLHIGAANYTSMFWVNGKEVCEHEGGFTAFNCEVTTALKPGANFVVAMVDSTRHADGVPTLKTDWWNYGGLTREVSLITVPEAFIDQYDVHLSRTEPDIIEGWVHVVEDEVEAAHSIHPPRVTVEIPELYAKIIAESDKAGWKFFHAKVSGLQLWSPENPKLYKVIIHFGADSVEDNIGFRTVETKGNEILLNGKPIFLRGICIHAEAPYRGGRAYSGKDAETLLAWAKELGANYVRLAHYPHDETMLRAADRMGVLVWSENPVYWAVQFDKPEVYAKAQQQLEEEIGAYRNHAAIVLWSMANETPTSEARTKFLSGLAAKARELDPTRLITAALLLHTEKNGDRQVKVMDDPLAASLDVIGANEYIGWYEGKSDLADRTDWKIQYDKPLIMSEWGAGARAGKHGTADERWTEEFQADVYKHQLAMLNRIPQLRGISPWILMDFRSPLRMLPGIQDGFNRKGLISDQGEKKQAFFILQKAYRDGAVGRAD